MCYKCLARESKMASIFNRGQFSGLPTELPTISILENSGLPTELPTISVYGSSGQPYLHSKIPMGSPRTAHSVAHVQPMGSEVGSSPVFRYGYYLLPGLSHGTVIFDLVNLTLKVGLLLKNFNLGHNFHTRFDRAFILCMCIPCGKTFHMELIILNSWSWPWMLTYFWKKKPSTLNNQKW